MKQDKRDEDYDNCLPVADVLIYDYKNESKESESKENEYLGIDEWGPIR